jgi:hypothetical protein
MRPIASCHQRPAHPRESRSHRPNSLGPPIRTAHRADIRTSPRSRRQRLSGNRSAPPLTRHVTDVTDFRGVKGRRVPGCRLTLAGTGEWRAQRASVV